MSQVRISVLSRITVSVDDRPARLTPTNARTLIRLVLGGTSAVRLDQLYRDVWCAGAGAPIGRRHRTLVQRQIGELRRILDPRLPGEASEMILTERGVEPSYRLALPRDRVDLWEYEDLAEAARSAAPETAIGLAARAVVLWPTAVATPLDDLVYAASARQRLFDLRATVRRRQLAALVELRRDDEAWALVRDMTAERPDDQAAREAGDVLRRRGRDGQRVLLRQVFHSARATALTVSVGDLFAAPDSDLVVGFTDTFDTSTRGNLVISADSLQGQLLTRLYGGDRQELERQLRRALAGVPEAARETRRDKRHGKLVRYPIGTVATLRNGNRNIFCVAYSRLGNDLVARSTVSRLDESLDRLWEALYRKGGYGEVSIPLVGSGRSRISILDHQDLLELIVRSFARAIRQGTPVCRELRITLTPAQVEKIDLDRVRRLLSAL
jgi:hypothetical protein